ncbi:helix-turn-helix domain-containing protein, partial [Halorubrum sp. SS7]
MGSGIRAEVSLPTAPSPFDGVVDGTIPVTEVSRCTPDGDRERVVVEFIAGADLSVP